MKKYNKNGRCAKNAKIRIDLIAPTCQQIQNNIVALNQNQNNFYQSML
jgi:hypothetical protein